MAVGPESRRRRTWRRASDARGNYALGFAPLRRRLDEMRTAFPSIDARFDGGALGYLSYEAVGHAERVPTPGRDILGLPDGLFMGVDTLLVFDHLRHTIRVVSHMPLDDSRDNAYAQAVGRIDDVRSSGCAAPSRPTPTPPRPRRASAATPSHAPMSHPNNLRRWSSGPRSIYVPEA